MLGLMPQADGGSRLLFAGVDWLKSAVWMSLGTDRRAENDDVLPGGDGDKRGWWGDSFRQRRIGSRLWLLERQKITADTLLRAEEYAAEALACAGAGGTAHAHLRDVVYRNRKRRRRNPPF